MTTPIVRFERVHPDAKLPAYATEGAAGADLCSVKGLTVPAGSWVLVPTGLRVELPRGYEGQVRPRSGLALKRGVTVLNAPGTIDSDYRGEIGVILINYSAVPFEVAVGDRVAQLVIAPAPQFALEESFVLSNTARASGGFGSTGQ